jgi:hypothetical protein
MQPRGAAQVHADLAALLQETQNGRAGEGAVRTLVDALFAPNPVPPLSPSPCSPASSYRANAGCIPSPPSCTFHPCVPLPTQRGRAHERGL